MTRKGLNGGGKITIGIKLGKGGDEVSRDLMI